MKLYILLSLLGVSLGSTPIVPPGCPASEWVDYLPATGSYSLRVVLSAPHGGNLSPEGQFARHHGCWDGNACVFRPNCGTEDSSRCGITTVRDMHTEEITRELRDWLCAERGDCPAAVINKLHRRHFDANREFNEATFAVTEPANVALAYEAYHCYMEHAISGFNEAPGLVLDMHGHGRTEWQRDELGYLLTGNQLRNNDIDYTTTSIRGLHERHPLLGFERLLRGAQSFGDYLTQNGYPAVPSPEIPDPGEAPGFFSGGYLTRRYGSRDGGNVDCIQIESARTFRDDRPNYVPALGRTTLAFWDVHYQRS